MSVKKEKTIEASGDVDVARSHSGQGGLTLALNVENDCVRHKLQPPR